MSGRCDSVQRANATHSQQYLITDGKGDLIIDTETSAQQPVLNYLPGQLVSVGGSLVLTGTTPTPGSVGHTAR